MYFFTTTITSTWNSKQSVLNGWNHPSETTIYKWLFQVPGKKKHTQLGRHFSQASVARACSRASVSPVSHASSPRAAALEMKKTRQTQKHNAKNCGIGTTFSKLPLAKKKRNRKVRSAVRMDSLSMIRCRSRSHDSICLEGAFDMCKKD